jgi:hypothetical protein
LAPHRGLLVDFILIGLVIFLDDNFQTFYVTERPTVELLRMVNGSKKKKEAVI